MKMEFFRYLYADFIKIKRRPVFWIHLLIPIIGVVFLLLTCTFSNGSSGSDAMNCPGAIAAAFPILIAVVCSMIADQESEAGNFQQMLTAPIKLLPFFSTLTLLLLLGLGAALLTAFGFAAGFAVFFGQTPFGVGFYLDSILLIFGCNIFLYLFHLILSLRFNKGVSIGVGIVESLMSALLITGLGDGKWILIPCAWGLRLFKMSAVLMLGDVLPKGNDMQVGVICCVVGTILMLIISVVWFLHWEGNKSEE